MTGNQAVQAVQAGLKAIYLSGWQVAGDANTAGEMYPDQSLYPVDSVPRVVERINNALLRTDQIHHMEGKSGIDWMAPIIADAEAGFGGNLNAFELTKALIKAGAAGVHFEDQLSSAKKCGHLGGKVLVSTTEAINKLVAARLAADVMDVPTLIIARTDADAANRLLTDHDPRDKPFLTGERSSEGFFHVRNGHRAGDRARPRVRALLGSALVRDLQARPRRGARVRRRHPREVSRKAAGVQLLAELQLASQLDDGTIEKCWRELAAMGYLPVHHAGRLARSQPVHVRARPRLPRGRHARLLADAAARVRAGATATPPPGTRATSARAISTPCRPPSPPDAATMALAGSTEAEQFSAAR